MPKVQYNPKPFAYSKTYNGGITVYNRVVSNAIPDEILATGNARRLQDFYEANKANLTLADLRYIQARLHTAWRLEELEMEAKEAIERGEAPYRLEATTDEQGYTGFENLKLEENQTSNNGCWSCGMHMLLKSRGIDLSQEEIRAYRPDFQQGEETKMSEKRRKINDSDSTNYVFDQGDLIQKVLPNSCVTNVMLKPLPDAFVLEGGPQPPVHPSAEQGFAQLPLQEQARKEREWQAADRKYRDDVRRVYNLQMRKQMAEMIRNALTVDRSPVVLNLNGGHFVTITGINADGTKVRVEDSFGSANNRTSYRSLDTIIKSVMGPGSKGMTLTWIKDLPSPEYIPPKPDQPEDQPDQQRKAEMELKLTEVENATGLPLFQHSKDAVTIEGDGSLSVHDVVNTNIVANPEAKPDLGQLKGQTISDSIKLDQTEMTQALGGGTLKNDVYHLDRPEAEVFLGDQQYYYPKKLLLKGDPSLKKAANYEEIRQRREEMKRDLEIRIQQKHMETLVPGKGTVGAELFEQRQELYLQSEDPVLYYAKIYATIKVMKEQVKMPEAEKDEQVIDGRNRELINHMGQKAIPVIQTLMEKSEGKADLIKMACEGDSKQFVELVDNYVATREQGANQDMEQRQSVIADAFTALRNTGTGRNYFGKERKANSPEYDEMMRGIIDYGRQLGPRAHISGFENHILTQKCLAYISDKMKVRSTTTGQIRFNNTMRILGQVMPEDEFSALCNRINRVRGVANKPEHDDYVSRETYVPAPIPRVVNHPQAQQPGKGKPGMTTPTGPTPK